MEQKNVKVRGDAIIKFDRTKANQVRDTIQANAVQLFKESKGRILLTWATGCGKTLAALKMIDAYLQHNPGIKGYLICKEHSHLSNWDIDIKAHNMEHLKSTFDAFLYHSLKKFTDNDAPDYIILDECHALTENRLEYLLEIVKPETAIIMLSATVTDEKSELLRVLCNGAYKESHISISKAIEKGILPPPKLFVHKFQLNDTKYDKKYLIETGKKNLRVKKACHIDKAIDTLKKYPNIELYVTCTEQQKYDMLTADMKKAKHTFITTRRAQAKIKWLNLGSQRKIFLGEAKTKRAKKIIRTKFKGSRFICFTTSKEQCEAIGGKKYVHSDLKTKQVIVRKDDFNNHIIDQLYVVKMFRESVNLVDVEKGLIVQLDNVKLSFIQMLGRVFRSDFPEMHIMIFKDTQDENYYKNVITGFDRKYITLINY